MKKRIVLTSLALVIVGACGGTGIRTAGSEPAQDGAFVPGDFANLPKPAGAVAYEPADHSDGVWTQSFHLLYLGPAEAMQFYATALGTGWMQVSVPAPTGICIPTGPGDGCTYRSEWMNPIARLEISTGPDRSSEHQGATELSLIMFPKT